MGHPWARSMSAGDGALLSSISWLCRFIPVHGGCCSFTHIAPLRAFGALAEMKDVLGTAYEPRYLDGFSGGRVAFVTAKMEIAQEKK